MAGSERRAGGRHAHRACNVSSPEEEHRLRVGSGEALEDRDGDRDCHASRISKSSRRQEAVHRSEEGSPEVVATRARIPSRVRQSELPPRISHRSGRARQNAHLSSELPRPKSGGGTIPGHTRDGGQTTATMDYAGPILPGFRETAWIQKSPYFHRAAKHGVRAYALYNH